MDTRTAGQIATEPAYSDKTVVEIIYKSDYCLPCYYMERALEEVLPEFGRFVDYRRVDLAQSEGKERFLELSISIFGEEGVYRKARLAPIPSMFLNGELYFDAVPPRFDLENALIETHREKNPGIQLEWDGKI